MYRNGEMKTIFRLRCEIQIFFFANRICRSVKKFKKNGRSARWVLLFASFHFVLNANRHLSEYLSSSSSYERKTN